MIAEGVHLAKGNIRRKIGLGGKLAVPEKLRLEALPCRVMPKLERGRILPMHAVADDEAAFRPMIPENDWCKAGEAGNDKDLTTIHLDPLYHPPILK